MEPMDQEELRKQAQRALTRRISADPESTVHSEETAPPRPVQRRVQRPAQQPAQQRRRQRAERRPQAEMRVPEADQIGDRIERLSNLAEDEARARAERRRMTEESPPGVQRHSAYRTAGTPQIGQLRSALQNKRALRQAILLNEILGKPVALRNQQDSGI